MKLRDLFAAMRPMFVGTGTAKDTARTIYGDAADGSDARRLELYENSRELRSNELAVVFRRCATAIGAPWADLAYEYFRRHPWGGFDYVPHGTDLAGFLARPEHGFPAWLPQLAAIEWAIYRAANDPEDPADVDAPPIRLATSVQVHRLSHDLVTWLHAKEAVRPPQPAERPTTTLIWRSRPKTARVIGLDDVHAAIIELVGAGRFDADRVPAGPGGTALALAELSRAGIVLGASEVVEALRDPDATAATIGADLSRVYQLAPFVQLRWDDGGLQLWSPISSEVIASDDGRLVAVAGRFARPSSVRDAIAGLADLAPAEVVEIADALASASLIVEAGQPPHPAIAAGWDVHEAAVYAIGRVDAVPGGPADEPGNDGLGRVALAPVDDGPIGDLAAVLRRSGPVDAFAPGPISLDALSRLLWLATRDHRPALQILPILREGAVTGVAGGVVRYDPRSHDLIVLGDEALAARCLAGAPTGVVLAISARARQAFRSGASFSRVLQDAGAVARTVCLVAAALGLGARVLAGGPAETLAAHGLVEPWAEPILVVVAVGPVG